MDQDAQERQPFLDRDAEADERDERDSTTSPTPTTPKAPGRWDQWILLAIASGACAAFNGVFAKL